MATVGDINPLTGKRYSTQEIQRMNAGLDPTTGFGRAPTTPTTTPSTGVQDVSGLQASVEGGWTTSDPYSGATVTQMITEGTFPSAGILWGQAGAPTIQQLLAGDYPQVGGAPPGVPVTPTPTFGAGAEIPLPQVTPAPPYEITPEQAAFEQMYTGQLTDWVEAGGYGIPEETQAQMIQQQTDALKAREQESLRVMRNTMERRGLTNSGLTFANEQAIRSNTSVAIAGAIADVQIKSALLKLASFEMAMGQAGQFLDYLSTQSQLQYHSEFVTWQAQQQATMYQWQGQMDILKLEINQAYQQQNIQLTAQLQQQLNTQQNAFTMQLEQMKIDAANEAAESEGFWSTIGTVIGFFLSWL